MNVTEYKIELKKLNEQCGCDLEEYCKSNGINMYPVIDGVNKPYVRMFFALSEAAKHFGIEVDPYEVITELEFPPIELPVKTTEVATISSPELLASPEERALAEAKEKKAEAYQRRLHAEWEKERALAAEKRSRLKEEKRKREKRELQLRQENIKLRKGKWDEVLTFIESLHLQHPERLYDLFDKDGKPKGLSWGNFKMYAIDILVRANEKVFYGGFPEYVAAREEPLEGVFGVTLRLKRKEKLAYIYPKTEHSYPRKYIDQGVAHFDDKSRYELIANSYREVSVEFAALKASDDEWGWTNNPVDRYSLK